MQNRVLGMLQVSIENPVKYLIPSLRTVMMMSGQHVEDHLLYYQVKKKGERCLHFIAWLAIDTEDAWRMSVERRERIIDSIWARMMMSERLLWQAYSPPTMTIVPNLEIKLVKKVRVLILIVILSVHIQFVSSIKSFFFFS